MLPWILCGVFALATIILLAKIIYMKKGIDEVTAKFEEHIKSDTNGVITLSSSDKNVRKLAAQINDELHSLQKARQQYLNGDKELKEAITNISHDLRTPLTAICGYLELLEKEEKPQSVQQYLSIISGRANALKTLTEELFRYSIDSATEKLYFEDVNIGNVIEESLAANYSLLVERNIEPTIKISETPIVRSLNHDALCRVFSNIISNAVKYSDGDFCVELMDDGKIVFSNYASKLDEIAAKKLFNRFFTVESARQSTGLGLSIAKLLTEKMNGKICSEYNDEILKIIIDFN